MICTLNVKVYDNIIVCDYYYDMYTHYSTIARITETKPCTSKQVAVLYENCLLPSTCVLVAVSSHV